MSRLESQAIAPFAYDALPGRVVFAEGAARDRLGDEIERLGAGRILAIASERDRPLLDELSAPFAGRIAASFHDVRQHVPVEVARAARAAAREAGADALLALGGGSAIGTAKAVALDQPLPIVALPTTYAGSEMTPIWGLTEAERKTTGRDLAVLPRLVVYDPDLTRSLPPAVAVPSAMNALAHCVEALYAVGANPVCSALAVEGAGALAAGIPALADGGRTQALYGAYLAGVALAGAGTSLHHRICHVLGGAYGLPHAETHTVVLPQVLAFVAPAVAPRLAPLAARLGAADGLALAGALFDLADAQGAPTALRAVGFPAGRRDDALELLLALPREPREFEREDVARLLDGAIAGRRPGSQP
ncbi:MAG TPA: maleylacetate reductase [Solirubrobacteraceae bacterium]|nr:maleylacetate reductase [Solirubrobacteraceae bacterium]